MNEVDARFQPHAEYQRLLLDTTRQIANSANLAETLPQIVDDVARTLAADCARLVVAPSDTQPYTFGSGPIAERGAALDAAVLDAVQQGGFVWTDGDDAPFEVAFVPPEFAALVALPLRTRDVLHGTLWLAFEVKPVLKDADMMLLTTLTGQVAIAIANARSLVAVRQRHEWLAAVLAHTPDPVLVVDRELRLQLANPAAQALFVTLDRNVIGKPVGSIAELRDLVRLFEVPETPGEHETLVELTVDDERIYTPNISDVITEDDESVGWVLVLQDITRFKRLHDNMSDFLSTVSHDMRTPLTYMKGYLDMLGLIGPLNDKQSEFVGKIRSGFEQITDMVEKILKAGRLDPVTGTYRLEREACDLVSVLDDVVNSLNGPAQEKGLELGYAASDDIPVLNVDRDLIASAFMNLAENAVKYTPEGGHVEIDLMRQAGDVVLRVADDGYGISTEDQVRLFRRNVRIHRKEWKRVKGSGLGLFIVKNVAQRHDGDAWVESAEGAGSTFYFAIPLAGANLLGGAGREDVAARGD